MAKSAKHAATEQSALERCCVRLAGELHITLKPQEATGSFTYGMKGANSNEQLEYWRAADQSEHVRVQRAKQELPYVVISGASDVPYRLNLHVPHRVALPRCSEAGDVTRRIHDALARAHELELKEIVCDITVAHDELDQIKGSVLRAYLHA
jgi:hypothetical protein